MQRDPDWGRLATYVKTYRGPRSQQAIHDSGGPSDTTIGKIEAGTWHPTRGVDDTLRKLDKGLGWTVGSAASVLAGGDPTLSSEPETPDEDSEYVHPGWVHMATLLWESIVTAADAAVDSKVAVEVATNEAVIIAADVIPEMLVAVEPGNASLPIIRETTIRGVEALNRLNELRVTAREAAPEVGTALSNGSRQFPTGHYAHKKRHVSGTPLEDPPASTDG